MDYFLSSYEAKLLCLIPLIVPTYLMVIVMSNSFPVEILGDQVEVPDVRPEGKGLARFSGIRC